MVIKKEEASFIRSAGLEAERRSRDCYILDEQHDA
jgi:hypothetical protein